tara:strand:- start:285 stop:482 length:198 start_codon:yes stop_codon:yes gene_type:complete
MSISTLISTGKSLRRRAKQARSVAFGNYSHGVYFAQICAKNSALGTPRTRQPPQKITRILLKLGL